MQSTADVVTGKVRRQSSYSADDVLRQVKPATCVSTVTVLEQVQLKHLKWLKQLLACESCELIRKAQHQHLLVRQV